MEANKDKSHEIARAVANKMLVEIGRAIVRRNQDRSAQRDLMRFYQLKNGGIGYESDSNRVVESDRNSGVCS